VSYQEFLKQHELPRQQTQTRPPPQPTPPPVDPNRELREQLQQIIQGFGGNDATSDELNALSRYVASLREQLNRLWLQPTNLPPGRWSATLEFTVQRNGQVTNVRFKEQSGNREFDQSLIRAMNAFTSTTPPPGARSQVFTIPFSMTVRAD
jgi:TonB family protein